MNSKVIKTITGNLVLLSIAILGIFVFDLSPVSFNDTRRLISYVFIGLLGVMLILFNLLMMRKEQDEIAEDMYSELAIYQKHSKGLIQSMLYGTMQQMTKFQERIEVLRQILDDFELEGYESLADDIEESITHNLKKITNRLRTFDFSITGYNMNPQADDTFRFIERTNKENGQIMNEMENLILEITKINEADDDGDLSRLQDTVAALRQMNVDRESNDDDTIDDLLDKYKEGEA